MASVNKAILVGNLGRDAELRFTAGGEPVANFSMATTEKFTGRDGHKRESTEWHKCVLWGKTAESVQQYLTKGKQVYVEGKITTKTWTDREGKEVKSTEIKVDKLVLLGGGGGASSGASSGGRRQEDADPGVHPDSPAEDDIPFSWILPFLLPALALSHAVAARMAA